MVSIKISNKRNVWSPEKHASLDAILLKDGYVCFDQKDILLPQENLGGNLLVLILEVAQNNSQRIFAIFFWEHLQWRNLVKLYSISIESTKSCEIIAWITTKSSEVKEIKWNRCSIQITTAEIAEVTAKIDRKRPQEIVVKSVNGSHEIIEIIWRCNDNENQLTT